MGEPASTSLSSSSLRSTGQDTDIYEERVTNIGIETGKEISLYRAAHNGDWVAANLILGKESEKRSELLKSPIFRSGTVLHIAVRANQVDFVRKLLLEKPNIDLDAVDRSGNTAYCIAVAAGASKIIEMMEEKKRILTRKPNEKGMTPAFIAGVFGHEAIASRLYHTTKGKSSDDAEKLTWEQNATWLFFICIDNDWFDLSRTILTGNPQLKLDCQRDINRGTALHILARKPSSLFSSGAESKQLRSWCCQSKSSSTENLQTPAVTLLDLLLEELSKRDEAEIQKVLQNHSEYLLINATKLGNHIFLARVIKKFPHLVREVDNKGNTIFHAAIMYRQVEIFRLIHETALLRELLQNWEDKDTKNNILHLAADKPVEDVPNSVAGAPSQMRKELLFYQELERFVPASVRRKRNKEEKTPKDVFTEKHKDLRNEGEKWMKKNASYCLLVATLIVTVLFPSAYTVPDIKNVSSESLKIVFTALSATNAIAMGLSAMSMVMFFSLLISRYAEEDFISSLPYRFKTGLVSLVLSLIAKMVYFSIATIVSYVLHESLVIKSIIVVPQLFPMIAVFVFVVYPLLEDTFHSPTLGTP